MTAGRQGGPQPDWEEAAAATKTPAGRVVRVNGVDDAVKTTHGDYALSSQLYSPCGASAWRRASAIFLELPAQNHRTRRGAASEPARILSRTVASGGGMTIEDVLP